MIIVPNRGIRPLLALGLLVALAVPSWIALSMQRSESLQREQADDAARLVIAQRIAAEVDHSISAWRRATLLLASEPPVRSLFAAPTEVERQQGVERLSEATDVLGLASIQAQDVAGHAFLDVTRGQQANEESIVSESRGGAEARIRLRAMVTDGGGTVRGQLVAFASIEDIVDGIDMPESGTCSVNTLDGRTLLDAEGPRKGIVLDVVSSTRRDQPPEAGISAAAAGGRNVAFALVRSAPLLITIAGQPTRLSATPNLLLVDGALLALGLLGIFGVTGAGIGRGRLSP